MAKRTGNFITLEDAVKRYSSDGTRFALAEAGDSLEDPNFTTENADNAILRLYTFVEWCQEMVNEKDSMKTGPATTFAERVFETYINICIAQADLAYEEMIFQRAIKVGFFDMMQARDTYRQSVLANPDDKLNYDLIYKFMKTTVVICAPVISHTSEFIWQHVLKENGSVFDTTFPTSSSDKIDHVLIAANDYLTKSITTFRSKIGIYTRPPKKKGQVQNPEPRRARIYIAEKFPEWHQQVLTLLNQLYVQNNKVLPEKSIIADHIKSNSELSKQMKRVMALVSSIHEEVLIEGESALSLILPFDEISVFSENLPYLRATLKLENIDLFKTTDPSVPESENLLACGCPGKPLIFFD